MRSLRIITLLSTGCLLAVTAIRQLLIDPVPSAPVNAAWLTLQLLPLLAVVPGMIRLRVRGYFFAIMVGMLYFVHGVQASFGPTARNLHLWGLWEALLAVVLVVFASYAVRALRANSVANDQ